MGWDLMGGSHRVQLPLQGSHTQSLQPARLRAALLRCGRAPPAAQLGQALAPCQRRLPAPASPAGAARHAAPQRGRVAARWHAAGPSLRRGAPPARQVGAPGPSAACQPPLQRTAHCGWRGWCPPRRLWWLVRRLLSGPVRRILVGWPQRALRQANSCPCCSCRAPQRGRGLEAAGRPPRRPAPLVPAPAGGAAAGRAPGARVCELDSIQCGQAGGQISDSSWHACMPFAEPSNQPPILLLGGTWPQAGVVYKADSWDVTLEAELGQPGASAVAAAAAAAAEGGGAAAPAPAALGPFSGAAAVGYLGGHQVGVAC